MSVEKKVLQNSYTLPAHLMFPEGYGYEWGPPFIWPNSNPNYGLIYNFTTDLRYSTYEDDKLVVLDVEVPGYTKDEIAVNITNKNLVIGLKKSVREKDVNLKKTIKTTKQESRTLTLKLEDSQLKSDPEVTLANGVLTLTWLKTPEFKVVDKKLTIK